MWPNPQFPADLVKFTEEILNRKFHFLCSGIAKLLLRVCLAFEKVTAFIAEAVIIVNGRI